MIKVWHPVCTIEIDFLMLMFCLLVNWKKLTKITIRNPSLNGLRQGLENKDMDGLLSDVERFDRFFDKKNVELYSAESRVTAIALLFHVRWDESQELKTAAIDMAQKLLVNEGDKFFLFKHEQFLLIKLKEQSLKPLPPTLPPPLYVRPRTPFAIS